MVAIRAFKLEGTFFPKRVMSRVTTNGPKSPWYQDHKRVAKGRARQRTDPFSE